MWLFYVGIWRKLNNWEIDHVIWFSLAYPYFPCCVWTAMIVLCTRADDHTGAGEPYRFQSFILSYEYVNICISISHNLVIEIFWKTLSLYKNM